VDGYLEGAVWASTDENGRPLSKNYSARDFAQEAIDKSIDESNRFIRENRKDLESVKALENIADVGLQGHLFWLVRNHLQSWGHGFGDAGERLTAAAQAFGAVDVFVGDYGLLYIDNLDVDHWMEAQV
jgi:hypothetical protein